MISTNHIATLLCVSLFLHCHSSNGEDFALCGNSIVEKGELCDNGYLPCSVDNHTGVSICKSDCSGYEGCQADYICGNRIIDYGEVCDGDEMQCESNNGYSGVSKCNASCSEYEDCLVEEYCGDGLINGSEECDDQNRDNYDGCSQECIVEREGYSWSSESIYTFEISGVAIVKNRIYEAAGYYGISVVDIADKINVDFSGTAMAGIGISDVDTDGRYLFALSVEGYISIIDLDNEEYPVVVESLNTMPNGYALKYADNHLMLLYNNNDIYGMQLIDVKDRTNPFVVAEYESWCKIYDVTAISGDYAVAYGKYGWGILQIQSEKAAMVESEHYPDWKSFCIENVNETIYTCAAEEGMKLFTRGEDNRFYCSRSIEDGGMVLAISINGDYLKVSNPMSIYGFNMYAIGDPNMPIMLYQDTNANIPYTDVIDIDSIGDIAVVRYSNASVIIYQKDKALYVEVPTASTYKGLTEEFCIAEGYLMVTGDGQLLSIWNTSTGANRGIIYSAIDGKDIACAGQYAGVILESSEIALIRVDSFGIPRSIQMLDSYKDVTAIALSEAVAVIAQVGKGISFIDPSYPGGAVTIAYIDYPDRVVDMAIDAQHIYIACNNRIDVYGYDNKYQIAFLASEEVSPGSIIDLDVSDKKISIAKGVYGMTQYVLDSKMNIVKMFDYGLGEYIHAVSMNGAMVYMAEIDKVSLINAINKSDIVVFDTINVDAYGISYGAPNKLYIRGKYSVSTYVGVSTNQNNIKNGRREFATLGVQGLSDR